MKRVRIGLGGLSLDDHAAMMAFLRALGRRLGENVEPTEVP